MDNIFNMQKPWRPAYFYDNSTFPNLSEINAGGTVSSSEFQSSAITLPLNYSISIPVSLAKSIEGKYFTGMTEDLEFGNATNAWARLYNPPNSGVNLFVNVWTASDITSSRYRVQIYFNSDPPGIIQESSSVTPTNMTIQPPPEPHVKVEYAVGVRGFPSGGIRAYGRVAEAGTTINSEEEGKFIFPPGGSFLVFLSNPATPTIPAIGKVAFGWWEEPISN
ncbi:MULTISPECIES: DUF6143 family protein [unclassified Sedimentibacter]|uniref:DUF6143 family protein n=1 Tax=unclassified Sedimentibacter TaxID=2649220 RepID=UPI0027DF0BF4|nr:DUF6143 family protein [Sedimentibacter sp. MB35-C1]WMJ76331.1 DUF6143 family protein [Sedimentibacter sp. MB35-C1]